MILDIQQTNEACEGGARIFTVILRQYAHVMDGDGDIQLIRPWGDPFVKDVVIEEPQLLDIFSSPNCDQILDGIRSELLIHALQECSTDA